MILKINEIEVQVNKKDIKNMHLYVQPPFGRVEVSVPLNVQDNAIKMFIRTNMSWIKKRREEFLSQQRQTKRQYVSGETMYIWGTQYFLNVDDNASKNSFSLSGRDAILRVKKNTSVNSKEKLIKEWYRNILKTEIERILPKWEKITGLKCDSWQTKNMITKWGTCNTEKKKIWLNLQLAKKTPICLEYIILHELIHLKEKEHNAKFISMMDKYMPQWKEIKEDLNIQILDFIEK